MDMHSSQKSAHRIQDYEMDTMGDEEHFYDSKKTNADDRRDMLRMGKPQEMRVRSTDSSINIDSNSLTFLTPQRNFRAVTMFGFSVILMSSWETILSTTALGLTNGGSAGFLYTNLATWLGFIAVYASMGEMGSMAPTSGGQ